MSVQNNIIVANNGGIFAFEHQSVVDTGDYWELLLNDAEHFVRILTDN